MDMKELGKRRADGTGDGTGDEMEDTGAKALQDLGGTALDLENLKANLDQLKQAISDRESTFTGIGFTKETAAKLVQHVTKCAQGDFLTDMLKWEGSAGTTDATTDTRIDELRKKIEQIFEGQCEIKSAGGEKLVTTVRSLEDLAEKGDPAVYKSFWAPELAAAYGDDLEKTTFGLTNQKEAFNTAFNNALGILGANVEGHVSARNWMTEMHNKLSLYTNDAKGTEYGTNLRKLATALNASHLQFDVNDISAEAKECKSIDDLLTQLVSENSSVKLNITTEQLEEIWNAKNSEVETKIKALELTEKQANQIKRARFMMAGGKSKKDSRKQLFLQCNTPKGMANVVSAWVEDKNKSFKAKGWGGDAVLIPGEKVDEFNKMDDGLEINKAVAALRDARRIEILQNDIKNIKDGVKGDVDVLKFFGDEAGVATLCNLMNANSGKKDTLPGSRSEKAVETLKQWVSDMNSCLEWMKTQFNTGGWDSADKMKEWINKDDNVAPALREQLQKAWPWLKSN